MYSHFYRLSQKFIIFVLGTNENFKKELGQFISNNKIELLKLDIKSADSIRSPEPTEDFIEYPIGLLVLCFSISPHWTFCCLPSKGDERLKPISPFADSIIGLIPKQA